MITKKSITIAVAGTSLLATLQARAQSFGYSADNLLLNFRNTASVTDNDLEVNLGPVSDLASFQGTKIVAAASLVQSVYGSPSASLPIGLSACAADASGTTGTLWLTRIDSTPGTVPTAESGQQVYSAQNLVAARIANIGSGANAGTIIAQGQATVPGSTSGFSYQAQAEQSSAAQAQLTVNFGGDENIAASKGSAIESVQDGTASVYEALWEVPVSGTPDTYLGYLTFKPSGEVDYTSASAVTQPPATLVIVPNGPNSVTIQWPSAVSLNLQQNSDITAKSGWTRASGTVTTANGTSSVTVTPTTGNMFYRLGSQ